MIDTNKELAAGDRVPACYPLLFDLRERLAVVTLQKMMYNWIRKTAFLLSGGREKGCTRLISTAAPPRPSAHRP